MSQVLEGSHRCGRIDHQQVGEQQEADPERVEHLLSRLEKHQVEMEAGEVTAHPSVTRVQGQ